MSLPFPSLPLQWIVESGEGGRYIETLETSPQSSPKKATAASLCLLWLSLWQSLLYECTRPLQIWFGFAFDILSSMLSFTYVSTSFNIASFTSVNISLSSHSQILTKSPMTSWYCLRNGICSFFLPHIWWPVSCNISSKRTKFPSFHQVLAKFQPHLPISTNFLSHPQPFSCLSKACQSSSHLHYITFRRC